jgi:hypothetical protein
VINLATFWICSREKGGGGNEILALCTCAQNGKVGKNLLSLGEKKFITFNI